MEDPIVEADITSFPEFVHGGITQQKCQYYNLAFLGIGFTAYFIIQIHFALVAFFGMYEAQHINRRKEKRIQEEDE